jgi:hypothetical protein
MSAARPPEGGSHRSRQAEGSVISAARPPEGGSHRSRQAEGSVMTAAIDAQPSSRGFIALLEAFRSTGGLAPGNLLVDSLQDHQRGDLSHLARLIVDRRIFVIDWRGDSWIPMFQFDGHDLSCKPAPALVRAELKGLSSGWAVASWFARPNARLEGCLPVDRLDADPGRVIDAARCEAWAAVPGGQPARETSPYEDAGSNRYRARADALVSPL